MSPGCAHPADKLRREKTGKCMAGMLVSETAERGRIGEKWRIRTFVIIKRLLKFYQCPGFIF
jgi:hypothetical protein